MNSEEWIDGEISQNLIIQGKRFNVYKEIYKIAQHCAEISVAKMKKEFRYTQNL